ncbi:MAG: proteasome-type protease [Alphaproteobacteria bacterium]|nr:proteasome-type protease [Alphaproteobacteria bacterium]MDX5370774.1 proteasome-type protease [Alphaproteobacteria bacterium]MDX5465186.1 proteasome-type protease [Alphaproteobacteria bacterium]
MTYCVALHLRDGLVLLSDTRTNAGVDHISTFGKMHLFENPGERVMVMLTAGNLALSQAIVNMLAEGLEDEATGKVETLMSVPTMFRAAQLVGRAVREAYRIDGEALKEQGVSFDVSLLLGGQIAGRTMRLFQIYAAGNFIEATADTPFLQIGEHKYGKPILDRAVTFDTDLYDGVKLALISMDSTLRSNLTVGMPIDLVVIRRDAAQVELRRRIMEDDGYFRMISESWSEALRAAHRAIPRPDWS